MIVPLAYPTPSSLSTSPVFFMSCKIIMPINGLFFKSPLHLSQTLSGGSSKSLVILPKYTPFFSNISIWDDAFPLFGPSSSIVFHVPIMGLCAFAVTLNDTTTNIQIITLTKIFFMMLKPPKIMLYLTTVYLLNERRLNWFIPAPAHRCCTAKHFKKKILYYKKSKKYLLTL